MSDVQAGHEKTITGLLPAMAGANLIYGLGLLEMGMTFDLPQLILDADIARMILYTLNGVPVNDLTLAVDDLHKVGPFKSFINHKSSFTYRKSQSRPEVFDRNNRAQWEADGAPDVRQRARERVLEILANHQPLPLPDQVAVDLRAFINKAERELDLPLSKPLT